MKRARPILVWSFLSAVLALALGFYLGPEVAPMQRDPQSGRALRAEIATLRGLLEDTRGELEMLRTRNEVDRQALDMLRREMAQRKSRVADLEEDLRFYRSLMAPEDVAGGLGVREPELVAAGEGRRFLLRVVVQQVAYRHELVSGELEVRVHGSLAGKEASYTVEELSGTLSAEAMQLKFRYFQSIEGAFVLPPGLAPRELSVVARATRPSEMEVTRRFPWRLRERFTHVGG